MKLPIDTLIPEILEAFPKYRNFIIEAAPGSGKTTRIPPALLETMKSDQEVWILVPRRLAAKTAASRVAKEKNEEVGESVGYHFRFEKMESPKTRLRFLTEGMFLRLLFKNPHLSKVGCVILDEFHERHLHTDVSLSYLKYLQSTKRPDLKIMVMSATLESEALEIFLPDCICFKQESSSHPLRIEYLKSPSALSLEAQVTSTVKEVLKNDESRDILIFLPGMGEIRKCERHLQDNIRHSSIKIIPLHGDLAKEQQELIFEKIPERKIILSTNIAESSLTIEGVNVVIDSGLHRQASYSPHTGIPTLQTRNISQSSAIQRAGRASRNSPGFCYRLYLEHDFNTRSFQEKPEIQRAELSQSLLELKNLSLNLEIFPWFESPSSKHLEKALETLYFLEALKTKTLSSDLTALGKEMALIPLHPRLSRTLMEASKLHCLEEASLISASLSENLFKSLDATKILEEKNKNYLIERVQKQILKNFTLPTTPSQTQNLAAAFLKGFPDQVILKKQQKQSQSQEIEFLFTQGGSGFTKNDSILLHHRFFLALDSQHSHNHKTLLRSLLPLEEELLLENPLFLRESSQLLWDKQTQKVLERHELKYGELILESRDQEAQNSSLATKIFLKECFGIDVEKYSHKVDLHDFIRKFTAFDDPELLESVLTRLNLFCGTGEFSLSAPLDNLPIWLERIFHSIFSLKEFQKIPLHQRFLNSLDPVQKIKLDQLLPEFITLTQARKTRIQYRLDQSPWIASRLQDFFGMKELPLLMKGKIKLSAQLLAPNFRPVQVTQDLMSFWKNTYPKLRIELSRRYPKHKWPEDPLAVL